MTDTTGAVEMIDPVTGEIIDQKQPAEQEPDILGIAAGDRHAGRQHSDPIAGAPVSRGDYMRCAMGIRKR